MYTSNADAVIPGIPAGDAVHGIVRMIVELVPASHWTFARFKAGAAEDQFISDGSSDETVRRTGFRRAADEFAHQSKRVPTGPCIAAVSTPLGSYTSGLTLVLADNRAHYGILTLFRTPQLGPFCTAEIRALTFALDEACDRFSEARLMEGEVHGLARLPFADFLTTAPVAMRPIVDDVAYYILNRELEIVLAWSTENELRASALGNADVRLPRLLSESVKHLTAGWTDEPASQRPGIGYPVPFLVVRTRPMTGRSGSFIGVSIERTRPAGSLISAAAHYRISPREVQVLVLLLRGMSLIGIAADLAISSSTVQDHIKRLIEKTEAGNRSEMIANVLRWNSEIDPPYSQGKAFATTG